MNNYSLTLPQGFESLAPFLDFWAQDAAAARAECRQASDESSREAFYAAVKPLISQALEYLDRKSLADLDEAEQRLMRMLLSFTHVAIAVELQREKEPLHAVNRHFLSIRRAPADEPAVVSPTD